MELGMSGTVLTSARLPYWLQLVTAGKRDIDLKADVVIVGAGLGGVAAALAALQHGLSVVLTEETDWVGGQISQQGVPPDEHEWIESHGAPQRQSGRD